ncbi:EAL domain-containing protein [Alkaliphilus transvaalensis]|uniref:EAL domain-containing protein n=1 Tax=Alkaliphilus transvaalensis TaxID=114628 RepID=UPI000688157A|nr:EAL domain-containing protein [Alkaliphilus transvaalensis]
MSLLQEIKEKGIHLLFDLENLRLVTDNVPLFNLIDKNLRNNQFILLYHPVHKVEGGISHYECLIRMKDQQGNLLYPGEFLPVAEQSGLMPQIDYWVIHEAIKVLQKYEGINLFVNISGSSLSSEKFLSLIEETVKASDIDPRRLGFEITETTAIKNVEVVYRWMMVLKKLGCAFALDDFGSGFSSYIYLNDLPIDYLKIDGAFIKDINTSPTKLAIVESINNLAHKLGIETVAEYVENEDILITLTKLGVDYCQGYYFSKPVMLNEIIN